MEIHACEPMTQYILRRFPAWRDDIQRLLQENQDFHEMCADYEELSAWLTAVTQPTAVSKAQLEEARALLQALEADILEVLQNRRG